MTANTSPKAGERKQVNDVIKARQGDDHEMAADTYLKGLIDFSGTNIPAEYRPNPQIQKWLDDASRKLSLASTMLNVLKHIEANPSLPTDPFYMRQIQALIAKAKVCHEREPSGRWWPSESRLRPESLFQPYSLMSHLMDWYRYVFAPVDCADEGLVFRLRAYICRWRGHPYGVTWFNSNEYEPDMTCRNCGDDLG